MATWLEIRCENQMEDSAFSSHGKPEGYCWTWDRSKEKPSALSDDSQAQVMLTVRRVSQEAVDQGWVKTRSGWYCPYCAGEMKRSRDKGAGN